MQATVPAVVRAPLLSSQQSSTAGRAYLTAGECVATQTAHPRSERVSGENEKHSSSFNRTQRSWPEPAAAQLPPTPASRQTLGGDRSNVVIQWDFVEKELSRIAAAWDAVPDFLMHLVLVIMFCFYFFPDASSTNAFAFRRAVRVPLLASRSSSAIANFKVATFYRDIHNADQYTDFVLNSLLPNMFDITYPTGSSLLVGAIRLRTQRVLGNRCNLNSEIFHRSNDDSTLTASSASVEANLIKQTCFGNLGSGGGSAKRLGSHLKPHSNELTPNSARAEGPDALPRIAGRLWLTLCSNWLNTLLGKQDNTTPTTDVGGDGSFFAPELGGPTNGSLWRYDTCDELRGPAKITWGVAGVLGSYHCGGFYFDIPFWRPARSAGNVSGDGTRSDVAKDNCINGKEEREGNGTPRAASCSTSAKVPVMNDPDVVFLPFYNPMWERVNLQNASDYARARMRDSGSTFVDDIATRFVATEFYLYQPSLSMFASVRMYAEVTSGGAWVPRTSMSVFRIWTRENSGKAAYSIVFFVIVVLLLVRKINATVRRRYHQASRRFVNSILLFSLWNWIDAAMFILLIVSGCFRAAYLARCAQLHVNLPTLTYAARYPAELDSVLEYERVQVYINAVVTVLLFGRTVRYFGYFFTPLVLVAQVLLAARATLIGVALLLLLAVTAFGMTGYVLLSESVSEFGAVDRSFRFFFYLLLRQVDVENVLRQAPRQTEVVFLFWAFLLCVGLVIVVSAVGILSAALQAVGADARRSVGKDASRKGDGSRSSREHRQLRDAVMPSTVRWILSHYVLGTVRRPSQYKTVFTHYVSGRGRAALLHRALRALDSYRRLRYPVRTTLEDVDSDVISEAQFMHAVFFHVSHSVDGDRDEEENGEDRAPRKSQHGPGRANPLFSGDDRAAPTSRNVSPQHTASHSTRTATEARWAADATDPFIVFFYEDVWARLCEEWATSMTSKEAVEMQRRVVWATSAVERVVGTRMDLLQRLPGRLASLEASVTQFTSMLSDIPVTSVG